MLQNIQRKLRQTQKINSCGVLKIIFTQLSVCVLIVLCLITYTNAQPETDAQTGIAVWGNLKNIQTTGSVFDTDKQIFDTTEKYLGEAVSVMASTSNPFRAGVLPASGTVTSGFGYRQDPFTHETALHKGVDIAMEEGTEVRCVLDGTVTECANSAIGGNYIKILHTNGYVSYYGHLQQINVSEGQAVQTGQIIALSGNTGQTTGPHLHFQLSKDNTLADPETFFCFDVQS